MKTFRTRWAAAVLAAAAVAALLLVLPAVAQPPAGGPGFSHGPGHGPRPGAGPEGAAAHSERGHRGHRGHFFHRLARHLELSEEQQVEARALHEQARAEIAPLRATARTLRTELRDLLAQEAPDPAAVGQKVIALEDNREAIRQVGEETKASFVALLTPEQVEKLDALKEARGFFGRRGPEGVGGRRGHGFGPGPGHGLPF